MPRQEKQVRGEDILEVVVSIPEEVVFDRGLSLEQAQALARQMTAVGLYATGEVSLGWCTEIAGMHKEDFMRLLGTYGQSIFRFDDPSELERDVANAWEACQPSSPPLTPTDAPR